MFIVISLIVGVVIGSLVNMGILMLGQELIPLTDGMDPLNAKNWELKYFLFPFFAHAIGTIAGSFITVKMVTSHKMYCGIGIGIWFLLGGVMMVSIMPAPIWFIILDLTVSYIPMGWLGWFIAKRSQSND
tara:strand:- start:275 stop:664 length:390 start_codon:yes stop_codon:yes gene_type:complete